MCGTMCGTMYIIIATQASYSNTVNQTYKYFLISFATSLLLTIFVAIFALSFHREKLTIIHVVVRIAFGQQSRPTSEKLSFLTPYLCATSASGA